MVDLLNKIVKHTGALGEGTVIEQDDKYITIKFANKTSKFMYPAAFEKFLVPEEQIKLEELKAKAAASGKKSVSAKAYKPIKRTQGQALTYLVFQGGVFTEECEGKFI